MLGHLKHSGLTQVVLLLVMVYFYLLKCVLHVVHSAKGYVIRNRKLKSLPSFLSLKGIWRLGQPTLRAVITYTGLNTILNRYIFTENGNPVHTVVYMVTLPWLSPSTIQGLQLPTKSGPMGLLLIYKTQCTLKKACHLEMRWGPELSAYAWPEVSYILPNYWYNRKYCTLLIAYISLQLCHLH